MLRFLLDENVRIEVKEFLESKKFPVKYASKGISNAEIASLAKKEGLILVTMDKHFLNPVFFPPKEYAGIIVFRIHPPTADKLIKGLSKLITEVKEFEGKTFVVEEERYEEIKP